MKNYLVLLLSAGLLTLTARAQVSSGSLLGDARDEKGGSVAGVLIQARDNATGFTRSAVTNSFGSYRIDDLQPGSYTVTSQKDGFQTISISAVAVEVNQKARLDFDLRLGSSHDTVTVTAHASPLQTDDASEGYLLAATPIEELPLIGRNIISLVTLGPGAIPRQLGGFTHDISNDLQGNRGAVAFNAPVNGARPTENTYVLDGAYNTDQNVYSIAVVPLLETVAEFRIQTSLASAEFAQSGGAVIDVATKPGTKQFHGNAFEFLRNEATDARGFFEDPALSRAVFRQNQYGGSLGGPLAPSTFFYASFEGLRSLSSSPTQHLLPDANIRTGDFTGRNVIFDPIKLSPTGARLPFSGNRIPDSRIDAAARKYLATYEPLPNHPLAGGSNFLDSTPNREHADNGSLRLDHAWGERNRFFGRYTINDDRTLIAGTFPALPTDEPLRAQQVAIGHTFSGSSWVNENHFSFTRLRVFDLSPNAGTNVLGNLGINGLSTNPFTFGLPSLTITDFETVQDSNNLPQVQRDNTWFGSSSLARSSGRHTFKAGVQFTHFTMGYLRSLFVRGNFIFNGNYTQDPANPDTTGDAFADFLLGFPAQTQRAVGDAQAYLRHNTYAAYVQDDWRLSPRINLSLGLRYEYAAPFSEDRGNLFNLDYSTLPKDPVLRRVGASTNPKYFDFAPRVGLAVRLPHLPWTSHETVFRAGYGIFFSPEIAIEAYDLLRNGQRNEFNQPNGLTPVLTFENGFPQTASTGFPSYFGIDQNARTPYVQQWSSSIQQELPGSTVLEIAYVGTKGTGLGRFRRFNTPAHVELGQNLPPRPGDLQSLRTFPDLGVVIQRQHIANSSYHSLQVKAEKRFSGRLFFLASFVWAKSIDDADTVVPGLFESFGAEDERNLHLERGLSFFDVHRRLSGGFVYSLPSPHFYALRNWQLSGNLTFQDGTPLNPVYFASDFANSGTPNRPNVVSGVDVNLPSSQRNADHFFNANAFSTPAPFTFGNAGRDVLPGPGNAVVDAALHRRFTVIEGKTLEFRAETFNALNHPNIGIPGPYPDFGPFFGKAFTAGTPRRMQFALRFDF